MNIRYQMVNRGRTGWGWGEVMVLLIGLVCLGVAIIGCLYGFR